MSILDRIVEKKRERLDYVKGRVPYRELRSRLSEAAETRDFKSSVTKGKERIRLVAEIKQASPSKGVIRENFDPIAIARVYERKGVDAISVLTEQDFFGGELDIIHAVRRVSTRPVLRKDFIFDEYQIYESRVYGADAVLLIASLLSRDQCKEYIHLCGELGLDVLLEVHDHEELGKALRAEADIIGINNRNLKTLKVDLNTTSLLKRDIPSGKVVVSESGIRTRVDVEGLEGYGVDAVLVGTSLMESKDIGKKIDELMGR